MSRAAVMTKVGAPLEIWDDIEVEPPHAHEVKVRIAASGVCHSDLSVQKGVMVRVPPVVLGHEGAGIIEEVGAGVEGLSIGDHVVISWVPQCGQCFFCRRGQAELCEVGVKVAAASGLLDGTTRMTSRGCPVAQMAFAGTFAEVAVVPDIGVVRVPKDLDLKLAALLGCAVLTGVGAALNTANIAQGDTVAVVGCGGVGLNAIQGAYIAGAQRVIAIDMNAAKMELAKVFGATDVIDASVTDPVAALMELTGGRGADVVIEAVGIARTVEQALALARRGGQAVIAGIASLDATLNIPITPGIVRKAITIKGCWYGSAEVRSEVPRLIEYYKSRQLKLDELVSRTISLDEVNDALRAMEAGEVARSVIEL